MILEVDHLVPVAKGGQNEILNLVTSCRDCNRGKGARRLSDETAVERQRQQLEDAQDRREQMRMIVEWKHSLMELQNDMLEAISDILLMHSGHTFNDNGEAILRRLLNMFSFDEVCEATEIAFSTYYRGTDSTWETAFNKIGGICYNRSVGRTKDYYAKQDN